MRNGTLHSEPVDFEFTAGATRVKGAKAGDNGGELELTALDPDHIAISERRLFLTVTGEGFTRDCTIVFDDEEMPTAYVNKTTLTCSPPMAEAADTVDVEVHRGEDMSDVLTFEFISVTGSTRSKTPERKPKKAEPVHKRAKKGKK